MQQFSFCAFWLGAILALPLISGCGGGGELAGDGPPTYEVTGKVTYNGDPVEGALVSFRSGGDKPKGAGGKTDANGEFTLVGGAVEGEHSVTVIKSTVEGEDPSYFDENSPNYGKTPPPTTTKHHIPEKFSKFESSGLKATVKSSGDNVVPLDLKD